MIQLSIASSYATIDDLRLALEYIISQIDAGFTSSYEPHWTILGEEEDTDDSH